MPLYPVVFFDLETTGLDTSSCHIIQLAAICGDHYFNMYMVPRTPISSKAVELTGFSVHDGALLLHGEAVPTVTLHEALTSFLAFLQSLGGPVLLAAHNAERFDVPILTRALRKRRLKQAFEQLVTSFLDTFVLSKVLYPGLHSHSQRNLVRYFLNKDYNAHNALEDVRTLRELYRCWNPDHGFVNQCSF